MQRCVGCAWSVRRHETAAWFPGVFGPTNFPVVQVALLVLYSSAMGPFEELAAGLVPRLTRAFAAAYGIERGQEALAEALAWASEHVDELLAMDNPGGYLYRVGQSRSRPRPQVESRVGRADFPEPSTLGLPDTEPGLAEAVSSLSEQQRICVLLIVVDEWTYQEVADLLDVTRSSVQSHVERGMKRLRAAMGVDEHAES